MSTIILENSEYPLTSFSSMITLTLLFLLMVKSLKFLLKLVSPDARSYESKLRSIISLNNTMYGICSGTFCICFVLFHQKYSKELIYIYYLSKIYEFLDIILVIALNYSRNSNEPLNAHFEIHHVTTLSLVWSCFYSPSSLILEKSFLNHQTLLREIHLAPILTNTFHHFLMYIHLGGSIRKFEKLLPWSGGIQLIVGVLAVSLQIFEKLFQLGNWQILPEIYVLIMYAVYLSCHMKEVSNNKKEN